MFQKLENLYEYTPLPLRLGIATLFLYTGITKAIDLTGTAGYMESLGLPSGIIFATLAMIIEIVGGAFILTGLLTRLTAIILTLHLLIAITLAYLIQWNPDNLLLLLFHAPVIASTIALMFSGPGPVSIDEKMYWE